MKTTKNIIALVLIVALAIAGCSKAEVADDSPITESQDPIDGSGMDGSIFDTLRHYVVRYVQPESIFTPDDASRYQRNGYVYILPVQFIRETGQTYGGVVTTEKQYNSEFDKIIIYGESGERYDSLCVAHNDLIVGRHHYLGVISSGYAFRFPATFLRMTLDVVSDTDYDAMHPARTSLSDVIDVHARSAKEIIDSDYDFRKVTIGSGFDFRKELFSYNEELGRLNYPGDGCQLKMPLKKFNKEYRNLVADISLRFVSAPDVTSTHRFTITYRDEKGKVLTTTTKPVTLKAK